MERALCHYWHAFLTNLAVEKGIIGALPEQNLVDEALKQYIRIEQECERPNDPVLLFRIANVWSLGGESSFAFDACQSAVANIEVLPNGHYFRMRIPRHFGLLLWQKGEDIRHKAERQGFGYVAQ